MLSFFLSYAVENKITSILYSRVGENNIGAPKMRSQIVDFSNIALTFTLLLPFFYRSSNFATIAIVVALLNQFASFLYRRFCTQFLFCIAPYIVIALPTRYSCSYGCRSFLPSKAVAKSKGKLIAISFISKKEQQLLPDCNIEKRNHSAFWGHK